MLIFEHNIKPLRKASLTALERLTPFKSAQNFSLLVTSQVLLHYVACFYFMR
jgi:hypothetical protein